MQAPISTFVAALVVSVACLGCTTNLGDLTIVSTHNVAVESETLQRNVEGEDCANMLLFIPLGKLDPNLEDAMDMAMEKVPDGHLMANVAIYSEILFTYIFNRVCLQIKGDVAKQS